MVRRWSEIQGFVNRVCKGFKSIVTSSTGVKTARGLHNFHPLDARIFPRFTALLIMTNSDGTVAG